MTSMRTTAAPTALVLCIVCVCALAYLAFLDPRTVSADDSSTSHNSASPIEPPVAAVPTSSPTALSGWLSVIWGDGYPGSGVSVDPVYTLVDDLGRSIQLVPSGALAGSPGLLLALDRRAVTVNGQWPVNRVNGPDVFHAQSIQPEQQNSASSLTVVGSQPWVSILCKFSDVAAEPQPLAYFQNMFSNAWPGLDHYWREQSYGAIDIVGSGAAGWYTLPNPRSHYVYDQDGDGIPDPDLTELAEDCTAIADADVFFPAFTGINLMFNDSLGCCAWGGGSYLTLDGESRVWNMTWEPPWGYGNQSVMGHEMGHGFGLPHSSGDYGLVYDNRWDVMSDTWTDCLATQDPTYGCVGQHTIGYHKDMLNWIPPDRKSVVLWDSTSTITLEQSALPQSTNFLLAQIPTCQSSHFYTVEARRTLGYDARLPGPAVVIHDVQTDRREPAHVVDVDNNGDTGDAGAQWAVGETFLDPVNGITVTVDAATATGFVVAIANMPPTPCISDPPLLLAPQDNGFLNDHTVNFHWLSPDDPLQTGYTFRLNTSPDPEAQPPLVNISLSNAATLYNHTLPSDGAYYWHMRTESAALPSPWVSQVFTIDTGLPTATFLSPMQDAFINHDQVIVEVLPYDAQTEVVSVSALVGYNNGVEWNWHNLGWDGDPTDGWIWSWDASEIADQDGVAFWVYVRDQAGNLGNSSIWGIGTDRTAPNSVVNDLPGLSPTVFQVNWSGTDAVSGVSTYDVQFRKSSSESWTDWQMGMHGMSGVFSGVSGHTYYFRSRARDRADNEEAWPLTPDTQTLAGYDIFAPLLKR